MLYLIGIDDTDNLKSRGTGYRARQLGEMLGRKNIAQLKSITRHQLLVSPEIPYTSHNSSACLLAEINEANKNMIADACRQFLLTESSPGSDVGLCIAEWDKIDGEVLEYGNRAKREVLTMAQAEVLSRKKDILLEGLTGTRGGIIGSLASVGLRKQGNDGRCLWLRGMRELSGIHTAGEIKRYADIDIICDSNNNPADNEETIDTGKWLRPILKNGKSVLYVEKAHEGTKWRILAKETIKRLSD